MANQTTEQAEITVRTSRNYAIAHAILGASFVMTWEDGQSLVKAPKILRLATDADKMRFLQEELQEGDYLYMENGGPNDRIARFAFAVGVNVFAIPTFEIGNNDRVNAMLSESAREWKITDEKGRGEENSDELTARKRRAAVIALAAIAAHDRFTQLSSEDATILSLKTDYRSYRVFQKILLGNYLRLLSVLNEQYILAAAMSRKRESLPKGGYASDAILQVIELLLNDIPVNERGVFEARIGLESVRSSRNMSRKKAETLFMEIAHELAERDQAHSAFLGSMRETRKRIERTLKSHPIYQKVLRPIPGCGPMVSVGVIATIVDIRRYASDSQLKAYAGYHHFADGSRARRIKGRASNWKAELKQSVFRWTQQTVKLTSSPWRAKLDQRKAYELYKLLRVCQREAVEAHVDIALLPDGFDGRQISGTADVTVADLVRLAAHVDSLREAAGVKTKFDDDEAEAEAIEIDNDEEELVLSTEDVARNKAIAKLLKGIKGQAHNKAIRWLGQKFLEHIFAEWRKAIGLPAKPVRYSSKDGSTHFTRSSRKKASQLSA